MGSGSGLGARGRWLLVPAPGPRVEAGTWGRGQRLLAAIAVT